MLPWKFLNKKLVFFEAMGGMIKAGLPLNRCFTVLMDENRDQTLKSIYSTLYNGVNRGDTLLSAAQSRYDFFNTVELAIIGTGEATGDLSKSFILLEKMTRHKLETINSLVRGLAYPFFILHLAFILPELPNYVMGCPTAVTIKIVTRIFLLWFVLFALFKTHIFLWNNDNTSISYGNFLSTVTRRLVDKIYLSNYLMVLSTLYSAGVPINEAMVAAKDATGAPYLNQRLAPAVGIINRGGSIHSAFVACPLLPRLLIEMISIGEESGSLDLTLARVADRYSEESQRAISTIAKIVPVIVYLGAAIYVGAVILGFWKDYLSKI